MIPPFQLTEDGFELQFAVNYLAPFLLTQLLLPKLIESGTTEHYCRIVNVSSVAHLAGGLNFDNLNSEYVILPQTVNEKHKDASAVSNLPLPSQLTPRSLLLVSCHVDSGCYMNLCVKY